MGTVEIIRMKRGGFTLVEVLIAILIFSISLLALVPLLTTAASIDRGNYLNVTARAMAADVLDSLMGLDSLADAVPPRFVNPSTVTDQGVPITTTWATFPMGNLDTIAVTVTYIYKGQLKTFVLTAQKAR